jgi:hypothetical protein
MSVDLSLVAEALLVLRAAPSIGRRRALRAILARYPEARALLTRGRS